MSIAQRLPNERLPIEPQDAHDEFASIEAAVGGTARGRWFLDEYVRRAQNRDNERIIATLTRIERMLTADAQAKLADTRQSGTRHTETRHAEPRQSELRQPELLQPSPVRSGAASFTPPIAAPAMAPGGQGAALPVLSALRASGALDAPAPAPRPAPAPAPRPASMVVPAARTATQSPARSLADTLEQALLATQPLADAGSRPEARKPALHKPELPARPAAPRPVGSAPVNAAPINPAPVKAAAFTPRVAEARPPSPYVPPAPPVASSRSAPPPVPPLPVPPAPALAPRAPVSPPRPREPSGPISIDANAFAQIEAMDAAMRGKLFA